MNYPFWWILFDILQNLLTCNIFQILIYITRIFCFTALQIFNDRRKSAIEYTSNSLFKISVSSLNINNLSKTLDTDATKIDVAGFATQTGLAPASATRQEDRKSPDKMRSRNILCRDTNEMQMARLRVAQTRLATLFGFRPRDGFGSR